MTDEETLIEEIKRLKAERNAVILAHNYQIGEVQDIADFLGDSLGLSRQAAATSAEVIVFCGVHFMAQTAKLLSPGKTVLMPDPSAGCPMADMITPEQLRRFKAKHPGAPVVAYVNTSAEVKAESDICCTSANAIDVVRKIDADTVLFVPDQYLAAWVQKHVPEKTVIPYGGFCPTHAHLTAEIIARARAEHPGAVVITHPECTPEVCEAADEILSTGGMVKFVKGFGGTSAPGDGTSPPGPLSTRGEGEKALPPGALPGREGEKATALPPGALLGREGEKAAEVIVATECGMAHRLRMERPDVIFHEVPEAICPNMKKTTLEKVARSLRDMVYEIDVPADVAEKARLAVQRMVEIG
jgi:quinolinate synthase